MSKKRKLKKKEKNGKKKRKKIILTTEENTACWNWARAVTLERRPNKKDVNNHVYCPVCKQSYCLGFDGIDEFCRTCFYFPCQKELSGKRICQRCKNV